MESEVGWATHQDSIPNSKDRELSEGSSSMRNKPSARETERPTSETSNPGSHCKDWKPGTRTRKSLDLNSVETVLFPKVFWGTVPLHLHHGLDVGWGGTLVRCFCFSHSRVVGMDVDMMQDSLGQGEDVDDNSLQDVTGLRKELVKAPAFGLFCLQDVGQDGHQLTLQPPTQTQDMKTVRAGAQASQ